MKRAVLGFIASDDPRVAVANMVALVLAWNTPFYPLYLLWAGLRHGVWLTLCSFPVFLIVPLATRHSALWGRVLLAAAGALNTVFCTWLLGEASGTPLFLLPCVTLAALLFRREERVALFGMLALPVVLGVALAGRYPASAFACAQATCGGLVWLNGVSVAVLTAFFGVLAAGLISAAGERPTPPPETPPR